MRGRTTKSALLPAATFALMLLEEHVSLRPYNTFGLDVQARYFARFASADELRQLLALPQVQALICY
jgi:UDP-N-acetylenolpyruvoylglucosamine reductase